jgi:hypothetical protein
MSEVTNKDWLEANQRYLMARLRPVRLMLERHVARTRQGSGHEIDVERKSDDESSWQIEFDEARVAVEQTGSELPAPSALDHLCEACSLSPFERDLLLLCAGVELDGDFPALCGSAPGDPRRIYATFSLALAVLPEAHWNALTPTAPLRRWRLIEVAHRGEAFLQSQLSIDERVLHFLAGISFLDQRLNGLIEPFTARHQLPPSQRQLAQRIAEFWATMNDSLQWPVVVLCGSDHAGKREVAANAAAMLGLRLHVMCAADVPQSVAEREALVRLWEREALLLGSALLLEQNEQEMTPAARSLIDGLHGMLLVSVPEALRLPNRSVLRVDVRKPTSTEQQSLWLDVLGPVGNQLNGELALLVSHFSLGAEEIHCAGEHAREALTRDQEETPTAGWLWETCRTLARPRLDDLAQRILPAASWTDLVLPEPQLQALRDIAVHVRHRATVYETWGFASKGERGLGISALFAGASGTGKTMAAEVLANELQLDLYRIDLSQVVSKYIGETEKNLRRVFEAAEKGGAVLLFDEADALFGKRSEVKDSHDRYANIEVSYLLQRMEAYRGLAILTTNLKSAVDSAFLRRLRFVIQFPFPDGAHRAEIWRRIFPVETPVSNIDFNRLARLSVPGGNIRNIALQAAFLAADADEPVMMAHLLRAARSEYAKLEKPLTETEIGGWS